MSGSRQVEGHQRARRRGCQCSGNRGAIWAIQGQGMGAVGLPDPDGLGETPHRPATHGVDGHGALGRRGVSQTHANRLPLKIGDLDNFVFPWSNGERLLVGERMVVSNDQPVGTGTHLKIPHGACAAAKFAIDVDVSPRTRNGHQNGAGLRSSGQMNTTKT